MSLFETGLEGSVSGLMARGKLPDNVPPEDLSLLGDAVMQGGTLLGDLPFMVAGAFVGAPAGTVLGGPGLGTAVGAGAGAFGLPAMLREGLVQEYRDGTAKNFEDYWKRVLDIGIETLRGMATGASTVAAGAAQKDLMAKLGAEVLTMVTVGAGLKGEVPEPRDFANAAILLGGLKLATGAPTAARVTTDAIKAKLENIYTKTGKTPAEVAHDAATDPTIAEDIHSSNREIPRAYITAYHGTPHQFEAFDVSKIGTGEGAQAYGHGLYFAENPECGSEIYARSRFDDEVEDISRETNARLSEGESQRQLSTLGS